MYRSLPKQSFRRSNHRLRSGDSLEECGRKFSKSLQAIFEPDIARLQHDHVRQGKHFVELDRSQSICSSPSSTNRTQPLIIPTEDLIMVCNKCQKALKQTELATPGVKRKSDLYYESPASKSSKDKSTASATLGKTGIGKVHQASPSRLIRSTKADNRNNRASSSAKPPRTPMPHTRARARPASQRPMRAGSCARDAHTRPTVCSDCDVLIREL